MAKAVRGTDMFISWSGKRAECLANRLREWLPTIIPHVRPFFSPRMHPGVDWRKQVEEGLVAARYAIVCVTSDSLSSSWLHFEAGALWGSKNRPPLYTVLLDMIPSEGGWTARSDSGDVL